MTKAVTEEELIERSLFPRVTFDGLQANIVGRKFVQHDLLTICILTLKNGFTVVGKSACAVPGNFKLDVGQRLAEQDAIGQVWPLMGYELKSKVAAIARASLPHHVKDGNTYHGSLPVYAKPMTLGEYNEYRGWELPNNESADSPGYLVEHGYATIYDGHHRTWYPKAHFDEVFTKLDLSGEGSQGGQTWRDRLVIEKDELLERLDKLTTFLSGPLFTALPEDQQVLMNGQMAAMSSYLSILKLRLGEV